MKNSSMSKSPVPLYTSMPESLLQWVNSQDAKAAISDSKNALDRTIEVLKKEQRVQREDLHRPITL